MAGRKTIEGELVTTGRGRPLMFKNNKELKERVDEYFNQCNTLRDLPTITELAVFLGTSRETLREYKARPEFVDTIKEAMAKCEAALEKRALLGGLNATMAIFSLKNNYGWIDRVDSDITSGGEKLGVEANDQQLAQLIEARTRRSDI